jgi:hypothetical protein
MSFRLSCFSTVIFFIWMSSVFSLDLSPKFQAKLYLRKAEKLLSARKWARLARVLGKYDNLLREHDRSKVEWPDDFYFHYAYALYQSGNYSGFYEKAGRYLDRHGDAGRYHLKAQELMAEMVGVKLKIKPNWVYVKGQDCKVSYNNMNGRLLNLYGKQGDICSLDFHKQGYESQTHTVVMSHTPNLEIVLNQSSEDPSKVSTEVTETTD